ncbi:phosphoribosylformimino-5-aminoimidazole carboxamide ribotide isomerase [Rhizopus microsporus]|uniref:Phosphoribosylformimino-5-aminoimidazole carboxamide ribotide isomerase n=2 Tax=Rhizopus TaxID=4842 RepID=A0A1X0RSD2_RHIZD|nr:phosphoribosylformimino-5-aminoimidazole carboxamide ribotide isomerase [Rhizopus microsporus]
MTRFNGCIDLHHGKVKQIVGGSLVDHSPETLTTNFVSEEKPSYYSKLYKDNNITRCHVIKLGPNNDEAAKEALQAWPGGLQVGGGITIDNAEHWLSLGASKVIVTSWLFPDGKFSLDRLKQLCERIESLDLLSQYCSEFLIHAADVEGLCRGIDQELVSSLGKWVTIPTTYAGGGRCIEDLALVEKLSKGKVDLTFGSALDIFGGNGVTFEECVRWNKEHA